MISHLLLAMILVASSVCDVHAKRPENYFSFSVAPGYSNVLTYDNLAKPYGFIGGIVGLGYEMHAGGFWWSIAGEAECLTSSIAVDKTIVTDQTSDFTISRWRECPHYFILGMPLLFGYRNDDFYIGAGPKAMLTLFGHYIGYMRYTNAAGESFRTQNAADLKNNLINAAACFEIGGTIVSHSSRSVTTTRKYIHPMSKTGLQLKLGFYAEYGFMNMIASKGTGSVVTIKEDKLSIIPLYSSNTLTDNKVTPFFAGVKITLLYGR